MKQAGLFGGPPVDPDDGLERSTVLRGLNVDAPSYPRLASARISALDTARQIEAAIAEVPVNLTKYVESLVVESLAKRIAAAAHEKLREIMLNEVPEYLRDRVKPLLVKYRAMNVKPWDVRGRG